MKESVKVSVGNDLENPLQDLLSAAHPGQPVVNDCDFPRQGRLGFHSALPGSRLGMPRGRCVRKLLHGGGALLAEMIVAGEHLPAHVAQALCADVSPGALREVAWNLLVDRHGEGCSTTCGLRGGFRVQSSEECEAHCVILSEAKDLKMRRGRSQHFLILRSFVASRLRMTSRP